MYVNRSKDITLHWRIRGFPKPGIFFQHVGMKSTGGKPIERVNLTTGKFIHVRENTVDSTATTEVSLLLQDLTRSRMGGYLCVGTNAYGSAFNKVVLIGQGMCNHFICVKKLWRIVLSSVGR